MPSTVGERIRKRRTELGLTQDELAQKAGISKSFLSDVENGKRSIGADTLLDLGRSMSVSLDYLMTGDVSDDKQEQAQIPPELATFAANEGLSVRDTLTLLRMHEQIVTTRKGAGKKLEPVNWREFYTAVKRFL
jgi:transcriptional regulator with XRE-family HTH domain